MSPPDGWESPPLDPADDEDTFPADYALTPDDVALLARGLARLSASSRDAAASCMALALKLGQVQELERELRLLRASGLPTWSAGEGTARRFGVG